MALKSVLVQQRGIFFLGHKNASLLKTQTARRPPDIQTVRYGLSNAEQFKVSVKHYHTIFA